MYSSCLREKRRYILPCVEYHKTIPRTIEFLACHAQSSHLSSVMHVRQSPIYFGFG